MNVLADTIDAGRVLVQLQAFRTWEHDSNLPDVIGRSDLIGAPELATEVLRSRLRERGGPEPPLSLPFPKDNGTHRQTFILDPYDDLHLALVASVLAPATEAALPSNTTVLATRFVGGRRGAFGAEGWRAAQGRRRLKREPRNMPVGGFDVAEHFATIDLRALAQVLNSSGAPAWACEEAITFHAALSAWPSGPTGLAAGPMGSALFGTIALLSLDRCLDATGIAYERWVDDFIVECEDETHFDDILAIVENQLLAVGQRRNRNKDWFVDAVMGLSGLDIDAAHLGRDASLDALRTAVEKSDAKTCRFVLGGMIARPDHAAVPFVVVEDAVWELAPKYAGDYLHTHRSELTDDDLEILVDRCTRVPTDSTAASIAHHGRLLAKRRVPASMGTRLFEAGASAAAGTHRAVSPNLYHASSVSKEKARVRHHRAIDAAGAVQDLHCQRGLIAGLRFDSRSRTTDSGLEALANARPDLGPTVSWVRS